MRKVKVILISIVFAILMAHNVLADTVMPSKFDVAKNKYWDITLNQNIDTTTRDANVYVLDKHGYKTDAWCIGREKTITVFAPSNKYTEGETYELVINKGLKNTDGKNIKDTIRMKFTIKSSETSDTGSSDEAIENPKPATPTNLKAWATSSANINIQWDPVENVDGYYLYYSNDNIKWHYGGADVNGNPRLLKWIKNFSVEFGENPANTKVYFKVVSVKNGIESDQSNVVSATTFSAVKYFPLLSTLPQIPNREYIDTSISDGIIHYYYYYTGTGLIDDMVGAWMKDGWVSDGTTLLNTGDTMFLYKKNGKLIANYYTTYLGKPAVVILGSIH